MKLINFLVMIERNRNTFVGEKYPSSDSNQIEAIEQDSM